MNCFLSKYYLLEKESLPSLIHGQTIGTLAQQDIPGIFSAMKLNDVTLTDAQLQAIRDFRSAFAKNYNYRREWLTTWKQDFNRQHGYLENLLGGWAWVALVPTGVYVVAQGELLVWRMRANEPPLLFENHDTIEPTQIGDIWFITWDKEIAKPTLEISTPIIPLHYAEKLRNGQTSKERFDILCIENQLDTTKLYKDPVLKRRILAINERLERAAARKKELHSKAETMATSPKIEQEDAETIPFIDVAAAYLIQQQTENKTFCLMDVDTHQTIFYIFSIENQKFRFQKETIVPHSKVLQKLFQLETASAMLLQELEQELPDIWNTSEMDMLMASVSVNHPDITYQDIKIGLQEWFAACPKVENHLIRQICSDHAIAILCLECLKMAKQPLMEAILSKKQVLQTTVSDNIYPEIRETIGVEFYDAMNQLYVIPLLQAGMTYTEFHFPHYSPFLCWAYWNQNPTLPTLKMGNQPLSIPDLRLPEWGKSDKTWGDFELKSFKIGVSVTRHSQIKLHLETATAKNQYLIGTI